MVEDYTTYHFTIVTSVKMINMFCFASHRSALENNALKTFSYQTGFDSDQVLEGLIYAVGFYY